MRTQYTPFCRRERLGCAYRFRSGVSEECLEVSPGQQLEDNETRVFVEADPDEMNDVGVVELAHDERLHQKVHLGLLHGKTTHLHIVRDTFLRLFIRHRQ